MTGARHCADRELAAPGASQASGENEAIFPAHAPRQCRTTLAAGASAEPPTSARGERPLTAYFRSVEAKIHSRRQPLAQSIHDHQHHTSPPALISTAGNTTRRSADADHRHSVRDKESRQVAASSVFSSSALWGPASLKRIARSQPDEILNARSPVFTPGLPFPTAGSPREIKVIGLRQPGIPAQCVVMDAINIHEKRNPEKRRGIDASIKAEELDHAERRRTADN